MDLLLLQVSEEATGEFDPVGTLFTLVLGILFAYGAYRLYGRYTGGGGALVLVGAGVLGFLAVLVAVAFLMNLGAAVGLV